MERGIHITSAADAAVDRYGDKAPEALLELITMAVRLDDDDLVADFDRILQQVEKRLATGQHDPMTAEDKVPFLLQTTR